MLFQHTFQEIALIWSALPRIFVCMFLLTCPLILVKIKSLFKNMHNFKYKACFVLRLFLSTNVYPLFLAISLSQLVWSLVPSSNEGSFLKKRKNYIHQHRCTTGSEQAALYNYYSLLKEYHVIQKHPSLQALKDFDPCTPLQCG